MVSIALALLLILGINQVFSLTSKTIGAGQAVSAGLQSNQTANTVMTEDFHEAEQDSPVFIIRNEKTLAYMDLADQMHDQDQDITTADLAGTGTERPVRGYTYNARNHRVDRVSFFARGNFSRQTADDGAFDDATKATEAYITYGHGWQPNNNGAFLQSTYPGTLGAPPPVNPNTITRTTNPNNFFARNWVLVRWPILLNNSVALPNAGPQSFDRTIGPSFPLSPLQYNSTATDGLTRLQTSRYDLARTTIEQFRNDVGQIVVPPPGQPLASNWWVPLVYSTSAGAPLLPAFRFQVNPFPAKPITSGSAAQMAPYFVGHVSQFIVEFAGDFLTQDNVAATGTSPNFTSSPTYGHATAVGPDGEIDWQLDIKGEWDNTVIYSPGDNVEDPKNHGQYYQYIATTPGSGVSLSTNTVWQRYAGGAQPPRRIRWYGLPRETSGDLVHLDYNDVVPVRDVIADDLPAANPNYAPFETLAELPTQPNFNVNTQRHDYFTDTTNYDYTSGIPAVDANLHYTCIWTNAGSVRQGVPALIRIIMTVEDESGRLDGGQTFEYILSTR
jgi:hypothetical protein